LNGLQNPLYPTSKNKNYSRKGAKGSKLLTPLGLWTGSDSGAMFVDLVFFFI